MCFSFEVSIGSFIFAWGISLYLLKKKLSMEQYHSVIFLMIFSTMQLADAILWAIKMEKNTINYIVTSYFIPLILSMQILYNIFVINKNKNIFISIIAILSCVITFYKFNGYSKSLSNNRFSSPIWGSNEIKFWEFMSFAILVSYPSLPIFATIILVIYPLIHYIVGGAYGSLWCAIGVLKALHILFTY